ncbi:MAG: hypothetical protein ACRDI2_23305, partial [Chloroflexota bacterium]
MSETETKIINFRPPRRLADASWRRSMLLLAFAAGVLASSVLVLNWQLIPGRAPLSAGDSAPETLKAPRRVTFT